MNPARLTSIKLLGTWFGCGRAPKAPGTFGTLGAIPLVWIFQLYGEYRYLLFTLGFTLFTVLVAQIYEDLVATEHDSPEFVIDEVAGFLVTMAMMPFTWASVIAGFLLFRIFDVLKPFPISYVDQKVPGGVGAVADDLLAGIMANLILQVLLQNGWAEWMR